ncbi:hypothetical protein PTSG_00775 [Salpingoeca rosetta]|uniref:Dolichol kinase n=1 Tax=Salpingoeca rosetta (strain ATCC 50818 / BSB-021) TaxID=946362 RepID=F2TXF7_SALR5|nr:uncharacterized protein PTSG_00775 [Salpingoeca rosetta]EGD76066.1 hypothetical protein PTSG_00775 [Salpingoeca rosetta]|eukprot:XP_004998241.1 hypothetical protein PTSG_00775 [Salpingoeca rosetta]
MVQVNVMDVLICAMPLLAAVAQRRKLLTVDGALAAIPVGVAISYHGSTSFIMLALFFVIGSLATKVAAKRQTHRRDTDTDATTGRNAWQVLATGGVPALLCLGMSTGYLAPKWEVGYFAYLACCCGDTLASEIGQLSKTAPRLISTFQPVPTGRDGAVSVLGTVMSVVGGAIIGAAHGTWQGAAQGALYGAAGSILDSWFGLVLQPPSLVANSKLWAPLNVLVNLLSASTLAIAVTAVSGTSLSVIVHVVLAVMVVFVATQLLLLRSPVAGDYTRMLCGAFLLAALHTHCIAGALAPLGLASPLPSPTPASSGCCNSVCIIAASVCALLAWGVGTRKGQRKEAVIAVGCFAMLFVITGRCPCIESAIRSAFPEPIAAALTPFTTSSASSANTADQGTAASSSSSSSSSSPDVAVLAAAMLLIQPLARIVAHAARTALVQAVRGRNASRTANEMLIALLQMVVAATLYAYMLGHWRSCDSERSSHATCTSATPAARTSGDAAKHGTHDLVAHLHSSYEALQPCDLTAALTFGSVCALNNLLELTHLRDGIISALHTRLLSCM